MRIRILTLFVKTVYELMHVKHLEVCVTYRIFHTSYHLKVVPNLRFYFPQPVFHSQLQSENIKLKIPEIDNS